MVKVNFGIIEVFSKGLNWITLPLLAYITSLELYGKISSYYSLVMILSVFFTFGQNRNILQSKIEELDENSALSVYISFFLFIISIILISFFSLDKNFYLCAILALFLAIYTNYSLKIRAENNIEKFILFKVYYLMRLLLLLIILWMYPSFKTFIWVDALLLIGFFIFQFRPRVPKSSFKELMRKIKSSLMVMSFSFCIIFIMGFDKIYLLDRVDDSLIGEYNLAFVFATGITFLASYFAIIYERNIYISNNVAQASFQTNAFIKKTIVFSIILFPLVGFIYWFYSKILIGNSNIVIFSIIYFSQLIYFFCLGKSFLLTYKGGYKKIAIVSIISIGVNILFNMLLVQDFSIIGSAFSNLISFLIMSFFLFFWSVDN
jgi:O-antigen/teichoic acid export membrane protein